jgi:ribokinase
MSLSPAHSEAPALAVVGAINVDLVVTANALPRAGETVVGDGPARHGGGKGANAALAAARAGASVRLIGAVGDDAMAGLGLADLREAGIDLNGVAALGQTPTGVALIVVDHGGENQIAVGAGANGALRSEWVAAQTDAALTAGAACVLVSTEIPDAAVAAAVRAAAAAGVRCVLNPAPPIAAVAEVLDAAPILTPNARELDLIGRMLGLAAGGTAAQAGALSARTGSPVIVTLGADGALLALGDGTTETVPAPAARVVDTTGAGDTFNGVLAGRLAAGHELRDAIRVAIVAASISVSSAGARDGMPHGPELEAALRRQREAVST